MLDLALSTDIFIDNELDAGIQELDMIFNTENTELIGYPEYGTNWHQFLWQLNPSPEQLKKYIQEKIKADAFFLNTLNVTVEVGYYENELGEMIYVVIVELVDSEGYTKYKEYKLQ